MNWFSRYKTHVIKTLHISRHKTGGFSTRVAISYFCFSSHFNCVCVLLAISKSFKFSIKQTQFPWVLGFTSDLTKRETARSRRRQAEAGYALDGLSGLTRFSLLFSTLISGFLPVYNLYFQPPRCVRLSFSLCF